MLKKNFAGARTIFAVHSFMTNRAALGVIGFLSLCLSLSAQQANRSEIFRSLNSSPPRFPSLTLSNGGFFSFTGYFRNKELGSYRAFMTDRRRALVIRFPASVIVISPERPENFVDTISQYKR